MPLLVDENCSLVFLDSTTIIWIIKFDGSEKTFENYNNTEVIIKKKNSKIYIA